MNGNHVRFKGLRYMVQRLLATSPFSYRQGSVPIMGLTRYYHVINKGGEWHLYAGNAASPILVDSNQAAVMKAARTLVRHQGGKIVVHRAAADAPSDGVQPGSVSDDVLGA